MDDSMLGTGAGFGSLVIAVLSALGLKKRIDNLENKVVFADKCAECNRRNEDNHKHLSDTMIRIEGSITKSIEDGMEGIRDLIRRELKP